MAKLCEHKYTIDMYMYLHVYEEDKSMTKGNLHVSWHLTCDKVLYGSNQRFSIPWSYNV